MLANGLRKKTNDISFKYSIVQEYTMVKTSLLIKQKQQ